MESLKEEQRQWIAIRDGNIRKGLKLYYRINKIVVYNQYKVRNTNK